MPQGINAVKFRRAQNKKEKSETPSSLNTFSTGKAKDKGLSTR
jgi:hypothetical protein